MNFILVASFRNILPRVEAFSFKTEKKTKKKQNKTTIKNVLSQYMTLQQQGIRGRKQYTSVNYSLLNNGETLVIERKT